MSKITTEISLAIKSSDKIMNDEAWSVEVETSAMTNGHLYCIKVSIVSRDHDDIVFKKSVNSALEIIWFAQKVRDFLDSLWEPVKKERKPFLHEEMQIASNLLPAGWTMTATCSYAEHDQWHTANLAVVHDKSNTRFEKHKVKSVDKIYTWAHKVSHFIENNGPC